MGTFLVLAILTVIVILIIHRMVKDKKAGKSLGCGMDCSHCSGQCIHKKE